MTLFYPDISSYETGISLAGMDAVVIKATEGTTYTNPDYARASAEAVARGIPWAAYHFLHHNSDPAAQARYFHSVAGNAPCMLDVETAGDGTKATVADCLTFAGTLKSLGGFVRLAYLPHWYWLELGSPSLVPLAQAGIGLVSSNYTTYSDTGPGWAPYGGVTPVVWQYTDQYPIDKYLTDRNAYKGTAQQFGDLLAGRTSSPSAQSQEDSNMGIMIDDLAQAFALDEAGNLIDPDAVTLFVTTGYSPFKTIDIATDWATVGIRVAAHTSTGWTIKDNETVSSKWFWGSLPACDILAVSRRKLTADDKLAAHPVKIIVTY